MIDIGKRKPLFSIVPQIFTLLNDGLGKKVSVLCRSSPMRSLESFELDDNCMLAGGLQDDQLRFDYVIRLTNLRISLWNFDQCVHLLNQMGSQLHSFTVTIEDVFEEQAYLISEIRSVSKISLIDILMSFFI
jgi:hypothetical protein